MTKEEASILAKERGVKITEGQASTISEALWPRAQKLLKVVQEHEQTADLATPHIDIKLDRLGKVNLLLIFNIC